MGPPRPVRGRAAPASLYFATVNAEFNWWLLIVGLVVGAGLVWFVLVDTRRREVDIDAEERSREAAWLSLNLADEGWDVPPEAAERLLELHRAYLEAPPPDDVPPERRTATPEPEESEAKIQGETPVAPGSELPDDDRVRGGA